jgi:hypothetical protein
VIILLIFECASPNVYVARRVPAIHRESTGFAVVVGRQQDNVVDTTPCTTLPGIQPHFHWTDHIFYGEKRIKTPTAHLPETARQVALAEHGFNRQQQTT